MNYNEQIEYLTKNPSAIWNHWIGGKGLFKFVTDKRNLNAGCLTMIRSNRGVNTFTYIKGEIDHKLTAEIVNDERLPIDPELIKAEHLPIFKEWQERIDKLQQ